MFQARQRRCNVTSRLDRVPLGAKQTAEHPGRIGIVLYQQNARWSGTWRSVHGRCRRGHL